MKNADVYVRGATVPPSFHVCAAFIRIPQCHALYLFTQGNSTNLGVNHHLEVLENLIHPTKDWYINYSPHLPLLFIIHDRVRPAGELNMYSRHIYLSAHRTPASFLENGTITILFSEQMEQLVRLRISTVFIVKKLLL